jgi:hypothetical protein
MNTLNNEYGELPRNTTYQDFLQFFVWHKSNKTWSRRQQGLSLGWMYFVPPTGGECFYLRTLLAVIRGRNRSQTSAPSKPSSIPVFKTPVEPVASSKTMENGVYVWQKPLRSRPDLCSASSSQACYYFANCLPLSNFGWNSETPSVTIIMVFNALTRDKATNASPVENSLRIPLSQAKFYSVSSRWKAQS